MMGERLRKALVLHDVYYFIEELLNQSDETLQPPVIDYKVLSKQLLEFKWPLRKVVDLGKTELTSLFLRAGNGSMNVDEGLHRAVYNFDEDHVTLFLQEFNADANSSDENLRTPIFQLYSDMYEYRANFNPTYNNDRAVKIMKMLIERGAAMVTSRDGYNDLQVRHILEHGTTEAVSLILDMDVIDLEQRYNNGNTVAHYLASNRNPNTLTLLRNGDFHVNLRDKFGCTPMVTAAASGNTKAVEFLVNKGADINSAETIGANPLFSAISTYELGLGRGNYLECILLLLEYGLDVQAHFVEDNDDSPFTIFDILARDNGRRHCEIIMQHLTLQAATGTAITKLVQNTIDSDPDLMEELDDSRKLLQSQIFESHTLFSVLTCGEEKLVSLMRNEQLAEKFQSHADHLKSINSIYYNRLLQKRLTKAGQIIELRGKAGFVVGKLMKMDYNCQRVVVDIVLQYLDLADLNTLLSLSV